MNGATMAEVTTTVTAITDMVRGQIEAVPINSIVKQPTLNSMRHLINQIATFASHGATTKWGGKHGFLPLVLSEEKIRLDSGINNLYCKRLENPELLNTRI